PAGREGPGGAGGRRPAGVRGDRRTAEVRAAGLTPRDVFDARAALCDGRSPLYAALCRRFADDPAAVAIVGDVPEWDAPLRLLAGLHFLVLAGDATWEDPLALHDAFLREFVREQAGQTNAVQRSWAPVHFFLVAAGLLGADELDVVEPGASAGLNLVWDRYRHRYAVGDWGPPDAPLSLAGEERTAVPERLLGLAPRIRRRVGID